MTATSTQVPTESPLQGELASRKTELVRLGFAIRPAEGRIVATRTKWHWDCFFTKLVWTVFVRRVGHLTEDVFAAECAALWDEAKALDAASVQPRGMQKGTATVAVFLADTVEPALAERIKSKRSAGEFARIFFPVIVDRSTQTASYYNKTPFVGGIYYSKLRHIAARLANPEASVSAEPLSHVGIGAIAVWALFVLVPLVLRLLR